MKRHYVVNDPRATVALVAETDVEIGTQPISAKVLGLCVIEPQTTNPQFDTGFAHHKPWTIVDPEQISPTAELLQLPDHYAGQLYLCFQSAEFVPYVGEKIDIGLVFVPKDSAYDPGQAGVSGFNNNRVFQTALSKGPLNTAFIIGGEGIELSHKALYGSLDLSIKSALSNLVSTHVALRKQYLDSTLMLQQLGYTLVVEDTGALTLTVTGDNPVVLPAPEVKEHGEDSGYRPAGAGSSSYVVYQSTKTNND